MFTYCWGTFRPLAPEIKISQKSILLSVLAILFSLIPGKSRKIHQEIFISGARGRNVPQQYVNIVFFASLLVNRYWNIYLYCVVIKQNISAQNSHKIFCAKNALITPFRVNYPKYAKGSLIITLWPRLWIEYRNLKCFEEQHVGSILFWPPFTFWCPFHPAI